MERLAHSVSALLIVALALIGQQWFTTGALAQGDTRHLFSLDGTWEIIFDPENKGREAGWHRPAVFSSLAGRRTKMRFTQLGFEGQLMGI